MSYIALYRKWRPLLFDDVVGQEHVIKSLKYSVQAGRIAHAYLFCGTRGTGKTTMAHILSRAINCLNPIDGNPCNQCEICKGILSGSILDVMEIDAASNNSVDNIRDIRDEVIYAPAMAKYKVYIIDEVHMLSTGAFNALLKTLEEPPAHVVFILATTEPHKLPATILSRCQRYDFRRITVPDIVSRLSMISKANGIDVDDEALKLIARLSDGALRDALSILDQCISLGNKKITYNDVLLITGLVNEDFISGFVDSLIDRDITRVMNLINDFILEGKDISQFVSSLILYYRNLLVCKIMDNAQDIIEASDETVNTMKHQASRLEKDEIIYVIKELSELEVNMRWATYPRVMLEVTLIKIATGTVDPGSGVAGMSKAGIAARSAAGAANTVTGTGRVSSIGNTNRTNGNSSNGNNTDVNIAQSTNQANNTTGPQADNTAESITEKTMGNQPADSSGELADMNHVWNKVLEGLKKAGRGPLCFILRLAQVKLLDKNCVGIVFPSNERGNRDIVAKHENLMLIEKLFNEVFGREIRVKCIMESDNDNVNIAGDDSVEKIMNFASTLNAPINIFDK